MASMLGFDSLKRRYRERKYSKEKDTELDQARYLSVSTGRLEPYLRALAAFDIYYVADELPKASSASTQNEGGFSSDPLSNLNRIATSLLGPLQTTNKGEIFLLSGGRREFLDRPSECQTRYLKVWTTRLRCSVKNPKSKKIYSEPVADLFSKLGITPDFEARLGITAKSDPKQSMCPTSTPHLGSNSKAAPRPPIQLGIVVDEGLETELIIEPHNLQKILDLNAGLPTEEAFTAIGGEDLVASKPTAEHQELIRKLETVSHANNAIPQNYQLHVTTVTLCGIGGRSWAVVFVTEDNQRYPPLTPVETTMLLHCLQEIKPSPQPVLIVNPAAPDWRREILWNYRQHAYPVS